MKKSAEGPSFGGRERLDAADRSYQRGVGESIGPGGRGGRLRGRTGPGASWIRRLNWPRGQLLATARSNRTCVGRRDRNAIAEFSWPWQREGVGVAPCSHAAPTGPGASSGAERRRVQLAPGRVEVGEVRQRRLAVYWPRGQLGAAPGESNWPRGQLGPSSISGPVRLLAPGPVTCPEGRSLEHGTRGPPRSTPRFRSF